MQIASGAFSDLLEAYFDNWALTPSERDVALMAIKGLSIADMARLRETRDGTIKAQCNNLHLFESSQGQRLTPDTLAARLSYCWPVGLHKSLKQGLITKGLKRQHFACEMIEIRSGLGPLKLVGWLLKCFGVEGSLADAVKMAR